MATRHRGGRQERAPDGYTLIVCTDATTSNSHIHNMSIDVLKDLGPVLQVSRQPIALAAQPALGVNSLAELVVLARQQPGIRYATGSGSGSPQHMVAQWFAQIAGIEQEQVAYRGGGTAIGDLIGGTARRRSNPCPLLVGSWYGRLVVSRT